MSHRLGPTNSSSRATESRRATETLVAFICLHSIPSSSQASVKMFSYVWGVVREVVARVRVELPAPKTRFTCRQPSEWISPRRRPSACASLRASCQGSTRIRRSCFAPGPLRKKAGELLRVDTYVDAVLPASALNQDSVLGQHRPHGPYATADDSGVLAVEGYTQAQHSARVCRAISRLLRPSAARASTASTSARDRIAQCGGWDSNPQALSRSGF